MGIRISEMEEATTFGADDYVPIVTNGTNKKALGQKIKDFIAGFFVAKDDNSRLITSLGQTFTDCNTVMTSGMYSANMGTVSNAPAGTMISSNGGQLIVTQRASDVRVFQTLFVYVGNGSKTEIYVRAQDNATSFSDWRHITEADGISFDNTGTGMTAENVQAAIDEIVKTQNLTITKTENTYFNQTDFGRLTAYKKGNFFCFNCNLKISAAIPVLSDFYEIGRITGWNVPFQALQCITGQTNLNNQLTLSITNSGIVRIFTTTGCIINDWYRSVITVPTL